ncbi:MAG: hypothetical protein FOGNACKC_06034 [Anaerolineae bacterium]|nr:hypothetical protein [Anaerolineae bacterium]
MQVKLTRQVGGETQTIIVDIDATGKVTAAVEGVAGPACGEISAFLDGLGIVTRDENTPDFYQQATGQTQLYGGFGG